MMIKLAHNDLQLVLSRTPKHIRTLLQSGPVYLGGGYIREIIAGNRANDIDLFGPSKDLLRIAANGLAGTTNGRVHETDNAFTVLAPPRTPVQFITRWLYATPEPVLNSFDFTVCQAVIYYDHNAKQFASLCSDAFYPDLAARRLVYTFPNRDEEAGGSLLRVRKFLARGYNIQVGSLAGVVARLAMKVDFAKCMNEKHSAVDERRVAQVITGLLREVDPNSVIDGLEPVEDIGAGN